MASAPLPAGEADLCPDRDYRAFLAEGRFMLLRGKASRACFFPPRVVEPRTGSTDLEWVEASGNGVIYSVTIVSQKPPAPNYNVVLVDLEEGPRMMSRVDGVSSEEVLIGMAVRAKIIEENDRHIVVFEPAKK
jgi:uncharacterized OB-fold protein